MAAIRLGLLDGAVASARWTSPALAIKRAIDVALAVCFALIALPVMALIAIAIRLDSPGPTLYRPRRIGRGGMPFSMYKFRTMVADAEQKLNDIAHLNVASGMVKIPNDPRVTRVGKWLRRFSLDELPQLFNVVLGHMSLVGPRPHDESELRGLDIDADPRFSVRPGLTGLWQVSDRTNPDLARRLYLSDKYVREWSLWLDITILARTVPSVLRGQGGTVTSIPTSVSGGSGGGGALETQRAGLDAMQPISVGLVQELSEQVS